MKLIQSTIFASILFASLVYSANAATVTYDYVGNLMQNTLGYGSGGNVGDIIRMTAVFDDPIDNDYNTPSFLSITDGITTLSSNDVYTFNYQPSIYSNIFDIQEGVITNWSVFFALTQYGVNGEFGQFSLLSSIGGDALGDEIDKVFNNKFDYIDYVFTFNDQKENFGAAGAWTLREEQVSAVPVPAALPLMASALGLFGLAKRRKQSV